jgi:hypothetical protein
LLTVSAYHPDIVILYDGVNDIGLPMTYESRPNFPYNFQALEGAWASYRESYEKPLWRLALDRSYVYEMLRTRFGRGGSGQQRPVFIGPNAIPAGRFVHDEKLVRSYIAEYLTNWTKLVELSGAYHFKPVCVLQPTGGLDKDYALPLTMRDFKLDERGALEWMAAFTALYEEADRQVAVMSAGRPNAVFVNLRSSLAPARDYFWDLVHVYDETNDRIAARLYSEIRPLVEQALSGTPSER